MWKFIKYSFNKAFEKNLLNLIIFFLFLSFIGIIFLSTIIFALQKVGLLSEHNFFTETYGRVLDYFLIKTQFLI